DHADVLLPGEAAHVLDLAELARLLEPLMQIVVAKPRLEIRASRGIGGFCGGRRGVYGGSLCGPFPFSRGGADTPRGAGVRPAKFCSPGRPSLCAYEYPTPATSS